MCTSAPCCGFWPWVASSNPRSANREGHTSQSCVTHLKVVSRGNTTPHAQPSISCVSARSRVSRLSSDATPLFLHRDWFADPFAAPVLSSQRLESHGLVQSHIRIKAFLRQQPALCSPRPLALLRAPEMIPYQPWSTRWPPEVADQILWFVSWDRSC